MGEKKKVGDEAGTGVPPADDTAIIVAIKTRTKRRGPRVILPDLVEEECAFW